MMYGTFRFLVEFVREPDVQLGYLWGGWLTMGQLPLAAFGHRRRGGFRLRAQAQASAEGLGGMPGNDLGR